MRNEKIGEALEKIISIIDEEIELSPVEHTGDPSLSKKVVNVSRIKRRIGVLMNKLKNREDIKV